VELAYDNIEHAADWTMEDQYRDILMINIIISDVTGQQTVIGLVY